MDYGRELPPGLQPPASGDRISIVWRAEVGSHARVGALAGHLQDLDAAVNLGELWGVELAKAAAYQLLMNRVAREGPAAIEQQAHRLGFKSVDLADLDEWLHWRRPWRPGRFPYGDAGGVLRVVAETQIPELLGTRTAVEHSEYSNPLKVTLQGSGLSLRGVASVLRIVRDWDSDKRQAAALADRAEAEAEQAKAAARQEDARADLTRLVVDEVIAGRLPVPPSDLLRLVTGFDQTALRRLSTVPVELELPESLRAAPLDERET